MCKHCFAVAAAIRETTMNIPGVSPTLPTGEKDRSRSAPPPRGTLPPDTADRAASGRGKKGGKRQLKEGKPTPHPEVAKAQAAAQAAAKKMYQDGKKGKRGPPKRDDL